MSSREDIEREVSRTRVHKAVDALLKYIGKQNENNTSLIEDEDYLYLVRLWVLHVHDIHCRARSMSLRTVYIHVQIIALKKIPEKRGKDKPIPLPLPHPLYSVEETEVCLFVKDHKGEGHKASKAKVKAEKIPGIAKVLGLSKLKEKYESHEKKRQLCNSYDLFLADDRILPSLPKYLGKTFFKKKKQPIPVKLAGKDWAGQVKKACNCTYMHMNGSSMTIRVARASHSQEECEENVMETITHACKKIPGGFKAVQSLYMKSVDSVALPILQCK